MTRGSAQHLQDLPMGRQATVQDVANACLFFASDESAYITGDSVNVMGGGISSKHFPIHAGGIAGFRQRRV